MTEQTIDPLSALSELESAPMFRATVAKAYALVGEAVEGRGDPVERGRMVRRAKDNLRRFLETGT